MTDKRSESRQMLAKTMYGLEDLLTEELKTIGAEDIVPGRRMVAFKGDRTVLYKANIHLRTALRILVPIEQFEADTPDEIYQYLYDHVDWSLYLTPKNTFAVETVVYSDTFTHSKFVAYRVKDAIADYFADKGGRRPNVSVSEPDLLFHIHISDRTVTLALDSSGESLHKRGYRVGQNDAPINEVLAAGILMRAGWKGETDFLDPMCGSGTFLTEAALIAGGIPPGIFKKSFAFERWPDFDPDLLSDLLDEWEEKPFDHKIYGSDIAPKAIALARANVRKAGVEKYVELSVKSVDEYTADNRPSDTGLLVTNPPYGERLKLEDAELLYGKIGSTLKHAFSGWKAWVVTSLLEEGFGAIGLKHFHREKLFNGTIEVELRGYELFAGKRDEFVRDLADKGELRARKEDRIRTRTERARFEDSKREFRQDRRPAGKKTFRNDERKRYKGDVPRTEPEDL